MPRKGWLLKPMRRCGRRKNSRRVANSRHHSPVLNEEISRFQHISKSAPGVKVLIMATRSVSSSSTHTLMRTPRLSMTNLPWGSGITISMGGGTSRSETWILPCTGTIGVGVCSASECARRILLHCRVNLWVESGLCLEVESPLSTVAAIPQAEQKRSRISRLTSAIAALVSRTRTPAVKNSTIASGGRELSRSRTRLCQRSRSQKYYGKDRSRPYAGSSQPLQREGGRSQEARGVFTG
jgi:hypothetical protein